MAVSQPHTPEVGLVTAPPNVLLIHLNNIDLLGAGICINHVVVLIMKLNHQDKAARGIITRAIVRNMIGGLWLHVGVLRHAYTIIQDDL
jgi:hypothetical protein